MLVLLCSVQVGSTEWRNTRPQHHVQHVGWCQAKLHRCTVIADNADDQLVLSCTETHTYTHTDQLYASDTWSDISRDSKRNPWQTQYKWKLSVLGAGLASFCQMMKVFFPNFLGKNSFRHLNLSRCHINLTPHFLLLQYVVHSFTCFLKFPISENSGHTDTDTDEWN